MNMQYQLWKLTYTSAYLCKLQSVQFATGQVASVMIETRQRILKATTWKVTAEGLNTFISKQFQFLLLN